MCPTSGNNLVRNCSSEDGCKYIVATHIVGLVGTSCDKSILIGKSWQAGGGGGGEAAHLVVNWSNPTKEMELAGSVLKAAQKGKNTLRD